MKGPADPTKKRAGPERDGPSRLIDARIAELDGNTRRAIDLREGDDLDEAAFMTLLRAAVTLNRH